MNVSDFNYEMVATIKLVEIDYSNEPVVDEPNMDNVAYVDSSVPVYGVHFIVQHYAGIID